MLPIPFAIASSETLAVPYIIGIITILIVSAYTLLVFRSLRQYRRKRNILLYVTVSLITILLAYQIGTIYERAFVEFGLDSTYSSKAYVDRVNSVFLYSRSLGKSIASDFYIIIHSENASFQVLSQQGYVWVNNRTVKVPFSLPESPQPTSAVKKEVYYTIDENVTVFSFSTSLEPNGINLSYISPHNTFAFVWNNTENSYDLRYATGFT